MWTTGLFLPLTETWKQLRQKEPGKKDLKSRRKKQYACIYAGKGLKIIEIRRFNLELKDTHKILGLIFDSRLTWKTHINELRAKAFRRINLLKCLAGMKWGADQGVHEMMVFSALDYGSAVYESASNAQLKRMEPVPNKGLRIALGAFCVCRTENIMCESEFDSLAEKRK
jgi:hypothetical protein